MSIDLDWLRCRMDCHVIDFEQDIGNMVIGLKSAFCFY